MAEPNPEPWAQAHMRWLALSRWDNEGGASPSRPTAGTASRRHDIRPSADKAEAKGSELPVLGFSVSVSSTRPAPTPLHARVGEAHMASTPSGALSFVEPWNFPATRWHGRPEGS
jgi:hypothetical protein